MGKFWVAGGLAVGILMSGQAIVPGRIDQIQATVSTVELTIETTVGNGYQVQRRTSLMSGDWVAQGMPFVAGSSTSVWSVATAASNGFFRVVTTNLDSTPLSIPDPPPAPPPPPPTG